MIDKVHQMGPTGKNGKVRCITHTLDVYQVCLGVDCCFKMGVILHQVRSENQ